MRRIKGVTLRDREIGALELGENWEWTTSHVALV